MPQKRTYPNEPELDPTDFGQSVPKKKTAHVELLHERPQAIHQPGKSSIQPATIPIQPRKGPIPIRN